MRHIPIGRSSLTDPAQVSASTHPTSRAPWSLEASTGPLEVGESFGEAAGDQLVEPGRDASVAPDGTAWPCSLSRTMMQRLRRGTPQLQPPTRDPSDIDATVQPALPNPSSPSYASEHAVVAGPASSILVHLIPDQADTFPVDAEQAGQSRLVAGVAFPSDVKAGLALGQAVDRTGDRTSDGSDAVWNGTVR
jgi:hypothetical protein